MLGAHFRAYLRIQATFKSYVGKGLEPQTFGFPCLCSITEQQQQLLRFVVYYSLVIHSMLQEREAYLQTLQFRNQLISEMFNCDVMAAERECVCV
jgi:hypothetical protein